MSRHQRECPHCGHMTYKERWCGRCHRDMTEVEEAVPVPPRSVFCSQCGAKVPGEKFCSSCGAPLLTPKPSSPTRIEGRGAVLQAEAEQISSEVARKRGGVPKSFLFGFLVVCVALIALGALVNAPSSAGNAKSGNAEKPQPVGSFTVNEYRMYRAVISTPMAVSEQLALENVAKQYGTSVNAVRKAADKVQKVLFENDWFGTSESEIYHASDWKGETR